MRHCRLDYEAIQPWPTKRPHHGKVEEESTYNGMVLRLYTDLSDDAVEQLGGTAGVEPVIPDDEPVFVLRSKDVAGPDAVRAWCDLAAAAGADPVTVERVRRFANEMSEWAAANGGPKVADTPPELLRPVPS